MISGVISTPSRPTWSPQCTDRGVMAMSYFSISSGDKSQVLSEVIFTFICCFSPYVKAPGQARRRFEQEFFPILPFAAHRKLPHMILYRKSPRDARKTCRFPGKKCGSSRELPHFCDFIPQRDWPGRAGPPGRYSGAGRRFPPSARR